jgi:hypothetical protein
MLSDCQTAPVSAALATPWAHAKAGSGGLASENAERDFVKRSGAHSGGRNGRFRRYLTAEYAAQQNSVEFDAPESHLSRTIERTMQADHPFSVGLASLDPPYDCVP